MTKFKTDVLFTLLLIVLVSAVSFDFNLETSNQEVSHVTQ